MHRALNRTIRPSSSYLLPVPFARLRLPPFSLAWHASGTFSLVEHNGGSNGSGMRFGAEAVDPANAGGWRAGESGGKRCADAE